MDALNLWPWLVTAVLMFWSVGAYNRLVRLRNAILRCFAPMDRQLEVRSALLQQQIELLAAHPGVPSRELEALQAARAQADTAWLTAKRQPASADPMNSLRLALQILAQVRERTRAAAAPAAETAQALALRQQLAACDNSLHFAQGQFNDAVLEYNAALAQFPAAWLGVVFGFRRAGPL
ncbi:MAG: LemA family protein [Burkholderiaceae bacterium]